MVWLEVLQLSKPSEREHLILLDGQFRFIVNRVGFWLHHNANDDEIF